MQLTGASLVHEGFTTWSGDLASPGTPSPMTWKGLFAPVAGGPLRFTASPVFSAREGAFWGRDRLRP